MNILTVTLNFSLFLRAFYYLENILNLTMLSSITAIWFALGSLNLISMEHEGLSSGLHPIRDLLLGLLFNPDRASNSAFSLPNFRDYLLSLSLSPTGFNKVYFVHHLVQNKCSTS